MIIGNKGYLHEYININSQLGYTKEIIITYNDSVKIGEIYVLGAGELPEFVEVWEDAHTEADLLLFSTHSDDEQLFFAGLIPYYIAKGANVEVVYFTNHNDNPRRLHEQIHGLYKVGLRNYPVIGFVPDAYSETLAGALSNLERAGYKEDDAIKFMVTMIRRFKPLVVVGHDEAGEYSHGQHILCTDVLKKALDLTQNEEYDTESINTYGKWDTPKTYLHLYKDNPIIMNYDEPLDYFNGLTAYEVSKLGYKEHHSQQYTWFTKWLTGVDQNGNGTPFKSATEITKYSPLNYGLYRTTVGLDENKNDMFENLTLRKDIKEEEETEENKTTNKTTTKKDEKEKDYSLLIKYTIYATPILLILVVVLIILKKKNKKIQP